MIGELISMRTLRIILVVCGLTAGSACRSGETPKTLLTENGRWRIRAIGPTDARGSYWWGPQNVYVDFVVEKGGEFYATGRLYDSGPGDYSFTGQFPNIAWVNARAIRLYREPANPGKYLSCRTRHE